MKIAVAGGTGIIGRLVVEVAQKRGHEVVTLSRSNGIDLTTGAGLVHALAGVQSVIDVTNVTTLSAKVSRKFFTTVTNNLLAGESSAGVKHHVALSIVGISNADAGYYTGKLAQEAAVQSGSVPYTIARAAQFHEFGTQRLEASKGSFAVIPKMLQRPVAAREVAEHLVSIAEGEPQKRAMDLVGPKNEVLSDLVRRQLAFDGSKRKVIEVRLPGAFGKALASGVLRGDQDSIIGKTTFDQWLKSADHT